MSLRRFEAIWCAQILLRDFVLIYPVYAIYMQDNGITAAELGVLFTVWAGSALLFEVPSGVLADRYPRKTVLVVSGLIAALAFAVWIVLPTFWGFAAGFVVWALGSSLVSGTSEAYLHDWLQAHGHGAFFERLYGRGEAAESIGAASALLLGGWLAEGGFALPLALSIAGPLLSALLVAFALPQVAAGKADDDDPGYLDTLRAGLRESVRSRALRIILAIFALLVVIPHALEEFLGVLLHEASFSLTSVGIAYGSIWIARSVGMALAYRLTGWSLRGVIAGFALGGLAVLMSGLVGALGTAVLLGAAFFVSGAMEVLLQANLQRNIDGEARATVTSIMSMACEMGGLALYIFIGYVAGLTDWSAAFAATAALSLAASAILFILAPRQHTSG